MSQDLLQGTELVDVKVEPLWGPEGASVDQHTEYEPESAQAGHFNYTVKVESCESAEGDCDVKTDSRDLYKDHKVKDEVVLGPEVFQQSKATLLRQLLTRHNNEAVNQDAVSSKNTDPLIHQETRVEGNTYTCAHCNYTTVKKQNMKRHVIIHTGQKPYKCSYCEYTSNWKSYIKSHEMKHTGKKPYKCAYCDYTSSWKSYIKSHEMTHTGEKPYKCAYCNYTGNQKSNLKAHEKTHNSEKPYKCPYCNYACSFESHIKTHLKIHAGEKLYKCSFCNYTCSLKNNIRIHEKTHTSEKPYKCAYCSYTSNYRHHVRRHENSAKCKLDSRTKGSLP